MFSRLLVVMLAVLPFLLRAQEPAEFVALKRQYDAGQQRVAADYQALIARTSSNYVAALAQLTEDFRRQGDLDAMLMLRRLGEDVGREGLAFCAESPTTLPVVSNLNARVRQRLAEAVQARDNAYTRNASLYAGQLKTMVTTLTQAGRIGDAMLVRTELEAVGQTAGVAPPEPKPVTGAEAKPAADTSWVTSAMPTNRSGGWMEFFDGRRLYGIAKPEALLKSGKVRLESGNLILDDTSIVFDLICTNVGLRVHGKRLTAAACTVAVRQRANGLSRVYGYFKHPTTYALGRMSNGMNKEWPKYNAPDRQNGEFWLECSADERLVTLRANGASVVEEKDTEVAGGQLCVEANRGAVAISFIKVLLLDE